MAPTTQNLLIVINNVDVTLRVPKEALRIEERKASQISTASFEVIKGQNLGLKAWQTVLITDPGYTIVHFIGYVTGLSYRKRGVDLTYSLDCQSVAVRLQKAVVDGAHTGYNTEVLSSLLSGAYPDLSGMFDFNPLVDSQVDEFGQTDYNFDTNNESLLDALDRFASENNASWDVETSQDVNVNYYPNPAQASDMKYATGDVSVANSPVSGYNPANVVWSATGGESGAGGIILTAELLGGYYKSTATFGFDGTNYACTLNQVPAGAQTVYLVFTFRAKISSGTDTFQYAYTAFDNAGNEVQDGGTGTGGGIGAAALSTSWQTFGCTRWLYSSSYTGAIHPVFNISCVRPGGEGGYTLNIDNVQMEVVSIGSSESSPFNGDDSGVEWMGTPNDSASLVYNTANTLNWRQDADAADYDLDLGNMSEIIEDFEWNEIGFDYANSLLVWGGYQYTDVLWEYPGNNQLTHFDLEVVIYPDDGSSVPAIDLNTGTDGTPTWTSQTVKVRAGNTLTGANQVLWDQETHWLEFYTTPANLTRAFRVDGRIKEPIKVTVEDQQEIDSTGVTLAEPYYEDSFTSEEQALAFGNNALEKKARKSCRFTTYEPGLKPNRTISITDSAGGISGEQLLIESVTWKQALGGGYYIFEVEAGEPDPDLVDIIAGIDKKASARPDLTVSSTAVKLEPLTFSGAVLTFAGVTLYKRTTA